MPKKLYPEYTADEIKFAKRRMREQDCTMAFHYTEWLESEVAGLETELQATRDSRDTYMVEAGYTPLKGSPLERAMT